MKINYQSLEKKIDLKFKNKDLLIQALTHKSYNPNENNEKIEFLGDRVLGLVIAKKLLEIYPDEKEGILDKKFASLVYPKVPLFLNLPALPAICPISAGNKFLLKRPSNF